MLVSGNALPQTGPARTGSAGLPNLGDGSDMTPAAERRLGNRIAKELYRDPDYIDDPIVGDYVDGIWQPLLAAARLRGELPPELDGAYAWRVLLGLTWACILVWLEPSAVGMSWRRSWPMS
jgi:hypothetical protein